MGVPTHHDNVEAVESLTMSFLLDNPDLLSRESLLGDVDPMDPDYRHDAVALLDALQPQAQHAYQEIVERVSADPYKTYAELHDMSVEEVERVVMLAESIHCFLKHWNEAAMSKTDDALMGNIPVSHPLHKLRGNGGQRPSGNPMDALMDMLNSLGGPSIQAVDVTDMLRQGPSITTNDDPVDDLESLFDLDSDDFPEAEGL